MIYVAWIVGVIAVLTLLTLFIDGLIEGHTDHDGTYAHETLVDYSMKFNSVKWAGWYVAYYGRKNFQEWKAEHDYTERRNARRQAIIDRREARRRNFLEKQNG